jgi:mono/diheme cytochrome c family protein
MMMKIPTALLFMMIVLVSCNRRQDHPGHIYYPDMTYSQAYETYSENPVFESGRTMRDPVEGTVTRDMVPFGYTKDQRVLAGKELINPFEPTQENVDRGKEMYGIYCLICHGELGDGQGHLFTSGKYPFPIRSLLTEQVQNVPDGEIYHVITVGFGVMGAHGAQIKPEDRWRIVNYVKQELGKTE